LVRERIFEPLQLEYAATLPEEALLHRASVGHFLDQTSKTLVRTSSAFLPLSWAPCGNTLMMSARDLIVFARAHMAEGVGTSGARILSANSARAMQQMSVDNKGKGYTYPDGMGIGWKVSDDGLLHHAGGGPGVFSVLYASPEKQWAAAMLTNTEHGLALINEFMEPWLNEMGATRLLGMLDVHLPSEQVRVDPDKYVGIYEDAVLCYRVSRTPRGLALSRRVKFAYYDNTATEETASTDLIPIGDEKFLLDSPSTDRIDSASANRMFAFRNPHVDGRMQHLGNCSRLYRRLW